MPDPSLAHDLDERHGPTTDAFDSVASPSPATSRKPGRRWVRLAAPALVVVVGAAGGFLIGRVTADKITDDETRVALAETLTSTAFNSTGQAAIDTLLQEGLSAHVAGDLDEAAAKYEQVLAADSANKFALFNRGLVAHTNGDLAAAIADYEATLAVDKTYVPARFNLGIVYSAQGEWSDAEAAFRAVVDLEADNTTAMYRLGLALIEQGDDAGGQQLIDEATAIDPGVAD